MKDRELIILAKQIGETYILPLLEIKRDEFMEEINTEDQSNVDYLVRDYVTNVLIPDIESLEEI